MVFWWWLEPGYVVVRWWLGLGSVYGLGGAFVAIRWWFGVFRWWLSGGTLILAG